MTIAREDLLIYLKNERDQALSTIVDAADSIKASEDSGFNNQINGDITHLLDIETLPSDGNNDALKVKALSLAAMSRIGLDQDALPGLIELAKDMQCPVVDEDDFVSNIVNLVRKAQSLQPTLPLARGLCIIGRTYRSDSLSIRSLMSGSEHDVAIDLMPSIVDDYVLLTARATVPQSDGEIDDEGDQNPFDLLRMSMIPNIPGSRLGWVQALEGSNLALDVSNGHLESALVVCLCSSVFHNYVRGANNFDALYEISHFILKSGVVNEDKLAFDDYSNSLSMSLEWSKENGNEFPRLNHGRFVRNVEAQGVNEQMLEEVLSARHIIRSKLDGSLEMESLYELLNQVASSAFDGKRHPHFSRIVEYKDMSSQAIRRNKSEILKMIHFIK